MVFTNITPFPRTLTPVTNISPLTYRDAATFLEYLETIKQWLNETMVPDSNNMIANAIAEFQEGIANAEATVNTAKAGWQGEWNEWTTEKAAEYAAFVASVNASYAAFIASVNADNAEYVAEITALVDLINNKSGPIDIQRATLIAPYTVEIDPLWPTNQPVSFSLKQDAVGNREILFAGNISNDHLKVDSTPNGVTNFSVIPKGDGSWAVFQATSKKDIVAYPYDATKYGVKADGATNDVVALNALITAVSASGGGTVMLPPSATVRVNSSINMASNVTLTGYGDSSVISLGGNVAGSGVIVIGAVNNVEIRDLKIMGNVATYTLENSGIWGTKDVARSGLTISNITATELGYAGIAILGDKTRVLKNTGVRITNCRTSNTGAHGILLQWGIDDARIDHCTTKTFAQTFDVCGITNGRDAYDTSITNCFVDGANTYRPGLLMQNGISIDTPLGRSICTGNTVVNCVALSIEIGAGTDVVVSNNSVSDGAKAGIQFTGIVDTNLASQGVVISGNTITRCYAGIGFQMGGAGAVYNVPATFRANRSRAYALNARAVQGKRLYSVTTAGTTDAVRPVTFGNTVAGATVADGTLVWTDLGIVNADISITGNVIRECTTFGIEGLYAYGLSITGNKVSKCLRSGIKLNPSCNMFTVVGNDLDGNNVSVTVEDANIRIDTAGGVAHVGHVSQNSSRDSGLNDADLLYTDGGNRFDNRLMRNSATPSVAFNDVLNCSNTVATSITNFLDANARGRVITILVLDAFTTFVHTPAIGANGIRLVGGVNYAAPANSTIQFIRVGQQWHEIARSTL